MKEQYLRTALVIGEENVNKLCAARVAVFGIGGVGGFTVEALARAGVGHLDLIDDDIVVESNLNRQIIALHSTLGMSKVDAAELRVKDINPDCIVTKHQTFFLPETASQFDFTQYDYVVDCIDTVSGKIQLVMQAKEADTPIICAMGAGNKIDPTRFEVADISKTSVCPLARVMRRELKARGVEHLKVVYSKEDALPYFVENEDEKKCSPGVGKRTPGSISFVPAVAGLILAGEVIKDLTGFRPH